MTTCGCAVQRYGASAAWASETWDMIQTGSLSMHGIDAEDYLVAMAIVRAREATRRKEREEEEWLAQAKAKRTKRKRG